MYEIISRLSENHYVCLPPQAFSNQCSSNRTHATRLHLNTGVLSSLFNSLLYLLIHSVALPLQLPSVSVLFLLLLRPSSVISLPPFSFRPGSSSSSNNTCLVIQQLFTWFEALFMCGMFFSATQPYSFKIYHPACLPAFPVMLAADCLTWVFPHHDWLNSPEQGNQQQASQGDLENGQGGGSWKSGLGTPNTVRLHRLRETDT